MATSSMELVPDFVLPTPTLSVSRVAQLEDRRRSNPGVALVV